MTEFDNVVSPIISVKKIVHTFGMLNFCKLNMFKRPKFSVAFS